MKVLDLEIELNETTLILSEILDVTDSEELAEIKKNKNFFGLQKSGKVVDSLNKCNISRSYNDLNSILNENRNPRNIKNMTRKITDLSKEIEVKNSKIIEQQRCISILEDALRENNNIAEFEQLLAVVRSKDERIEELEGIMNKKTVCNITQYKDKRIVELEEALKESFMVAAERERIFYEEEQKRIDNLRKIEKLEQRVKSLQNGRALSCPACGPVLRRVRQLYHLVAVVQNILEEAITEKDSQIAEMEMKGVLDESETARCEQLKRDRDRLLERLKIENQRILDLESNSTLEPVDLTVADDIIPVYEDNDEDIPATTL